jgi:hypothetical protein
MIHELDLMLVTGSSHQNRSYVAQALIEARLKSNPLKPVAFFAFARKDDGLILLNRSLHWVSDLDPNPARAAALALAHHMDCDSLEAALLSVVNSRDACIIFASGAREDCPVEKPLITLTAS